MNIEDLTGFHPNDDEIELINSRNPIPLSKGSGIVLRIYAINQKEDRGKDVFEEYAMERMGLLAVKNRVPILLAGSGDDSDHSWMAKNTKGFVFDYIVQEGVLYYKAFFPLTSSNKPVVEDILHGLYTKGSVGFAINPKDYVCSACDKPIVCKECPHIPGKNGVFAKIKDVSDNFEYSLVAVPMVSESGVPKQKGVTMSEEIIKEEEEVLEGPSTTEIQVNLEPSIKTVQVNLELNESSKALLEKLENFSKNLGNDKITNDDTIQDNKMSELEEVKEVDTTGTPVEDPKHKELLDCIKELKGILAGLHEKMDSMKGQMDEMKALKEVVVEEEVEEPANTKSLEERINEPLNPVHKSVNDKLWERLTLGVNQ